MMSAGPERGIGFKRYVHLYSSCVTIRDWRATVHHNVDKALNRMHGPQAVPCGLLYKQEAKPITHESPREQHCLFKNCHAMDRIGSSLSAKLLRYLHEQLFREPKI